MKKVLLFVGIGAAGYYVYRVARLAGTHVTNDPNSATEPLGDALKSQASIALLAGAALLAYKVF